MDIVSAMFGRAVADIEDLGSKMWALSSGSHGPVESELAEKLNMGRREFAAIAAQCDYSAWAIRNGQRFVLPSREWVMATGKNGVLASEVADVIRLPFPITCVLYDTDYGEPSETTINKINVSGIEYSDIVTKSKGNRTDGWGIAIAIDQSRVPNWNDLKRHRIGMPIKFGPRSKEEFWERAFLLCTVGKVGKTGWSALPANAVCAIAEGVSLTPCFLNREIYDAGSGYNELLPDAYAIGNLMVALAAKNVQPESVSVPDRVNEKRRARGKNELFSYHVLNIDGRRLNEKNDMGGTHASPRAHWRRGHVRNLPSGGFTWVRSCFVSGAGFVDKDYVVG